MIYEPRTDEKFFEWVEKEVNGYFINLVDNPSHREYPKLHRTTHKSARTRKRSHYTDHKPYFKWCGLDSTELEKEAVGKYGKLTRCKDKSCKL